MTTELTIDARSIKRRLFSRRLLVSIGIAVLLPMLLGPQCDEQEPNNDVLTANLLRMGEYGHGNIGPVADTDILQTQPVTELDLIYAYVDPQGSRRAWTRSLK